jgi:hypothetical protein
MAEYKIQIMKLSSGKLQFCDWKSPLLAREHIVLRPCWYFTFLHAGRNLRHWRIVNTIMGEGQNVPAPTGGFSIPRTVTFFSTIHLSGVTVSPSRD